MGGSGASAQCLFANLEGAKGYLGYFNFVYGEVGVGVWLGGVENLHYGDGSECVFAKLLGRYISSVKDKLAPGFDYSSCSASLAS